MKEIYEAKDLKAKDLMVARLDAEDNPIMVDGEADQYLNWMGLVTLFRKVFPNGNIETSLVREDDEAVIFKAICSAGEDGPIATAYFKQVYEGDICDTFRTCQSMALRQAMAYLGIGTVSMLEAEQERRLHKKERIEKILEDTPVLDPGEMFDAITNGSSTKEEKKESPTPEKESVATIGTEPPEKKEEQLEGQIEIEVAAKKPESAKKERKPRKAKNPFEEAGIAPKVIEEETEAASEEDPKEELVSDSPVNPGEYIIKDTDFKVERYNNRYKGKKLSDIPEDVLLVFADGVNESVTDEFLTVIKEYLA